MPRPTKTQWDFSGELFPPETGRRVYSVSELTAAVRKTLEQKFGILWISGEITNFRRQSSGHCYFTLKDAAAQLSCVLFRNDPVASREALADGLQVVLQGEMTVYEARGQYQLHVLAVELQGAGALQAAFEKLKQKLSAEGLFAPERKRSLPPYPCRLGLVTSPTGAALRDVLHVAHRRNPALEFVLAPSAVQGAGAGAEIAAAIQLLNEWSRSSEDKLDAILITRGGGSLEDLWAFNEEVVARAIVASDLPIVSAVGHEIDFTISDFAADVRAATPSAAAEILTEDVLAARRWLADVPERLRQLAGQFLAEARLDCDQLGRRLARAQPRRILREKAQRLDELQTSLARAIRFDFTKLATRLRDLSDRLARVRPTQVLAVRRERMDQQTRRLHELAHHSWDLRRQRFTALESRLRLLGPEQVLARGYSITSDAQTGEVIRDATGVEAGRQLRTRLGKGELRSVVES